MRDVCRNFQRGSCQYGERCKFQHVVQQQRKPNVPAFGGQNTSHHQHQNNTNPFGFGSHNASHQNHNTNSFGFGMQQNTSQSKRGPPSDFKQNQFKPFENKWNRFSSNPQSGASRQSDNNSNLVNHKCTDPQVCKRQIAEDFEQEKPLWILTCYSHCKGAACDIVGDISYEELRAAAYEDAKQGMSLQSIVEKERNILKSKLAEFEKLLTEPYAKPLNSSLDSQNQQSIGASANPFSRTTQNNGPLSVSSFSQLGASLNTGFERPSAPLMNTPAQSGFFGTGSTQLMNTPMQPNFFGSGGNSLASNTTNPSSRGISGAPSSPYSTPVELTMFPGPTSQQTSIAFNGSSSSTMFQTSDVQSLNKPQAENVSGDDSIWLKEKWIPGEIPEEAPPDKFCF